MWIILDSRTLSSEPLLCAGRSGWTPSHPRALLSQHVAETFSFISLLPPGSLSLPKQRTLGDLEARCDLAAGTLADLFSLVLRLPLSDSAADDITDTHGSAP